MKTLGNILWLLLAGIWLAIGYAIAGIINVIFIITIPFAVASFRMANFVLWPFGRTIVEKPGAGAASAIGNVLWIIFGGLELAIGHLLTGLILCITIVGIPLGLASFKMIPISLTPLGKQIVPSDAPYPMAR